MKNQTDEQIYENYSSEFCREKIKEIVEEKVKFKVSNDNGQTYKLCTFSLDKNQAYTSIMKAIKITPKIHELNHFAITSTRAQQVIHAYLHKQCRDGKLIIKYDGLKQKIDKILNI